MKKEGKGRISEKKTNFTIIVGLHVRAISVFRKKSDAVCGFLAYFCVVLWFSDPPYAPLYLDHPSPISMMPEWHIDPSRNFQLAVSHAFMQNKVE